jgi:iron complex transport system ATP-binding protein
MAVVVPEPFIEVRGASFRYGEREIFSGLDLEVRSGEVLSILGPNGCGKSTLLRCIGGAMPLAAGSVRLGGVDVSALNAAARARRIGFLFQQHVPSFPFPVLDVVSMGRAPHLSAFGAPSAKDFALAEQALERVGMHAFASRPYTELSGGERQLVLLARTLVQAPEVILLDEPTSHLDFKNQALSLRTIGTLASQGVTMIMTTHDPNHALQFQNGRVALMRPGGLVAIGPAEEVITEANLSSTYGIDVAVYAVAAPEGGPVRRICSPRLMQ